MIRDILHLIVWTGFHVGKRALSTIKESLRFAWMVIVVAGALIIAFPLVGIMKIIDKITGEEDLVNS